MFGFREVSVGDAEMLLAWRQSPRVTEPMNSDIDNTLGQQRQWIVCCYQKPSYYHWVIEYKNAPIGLICLDDYDSEAKACSWGFYIGDPQFAGLGGFVPPFFYNFLFQDLGLASINARVWVENTAVIRLHRLHGYRLRPTQDNVIRKNGQDRLLIAMELRQETYDFDRFGRFQADFPTSRWAARPATW